MASTLPSPRIATGERRKRSTIRRRGVARERAAAANSRSSSTFLRAVNVPSSASHSRETGSSSTSPGSTRRSTPSRRPSSRSSALVNAACAGPAAAEHDDLLDAALAQRLERVIGDVGALQLARRSSVSMRVTSAATLPLPITTARRADRSNSSSR